MHIPRHPAALAASLLAVGALGTGVALAATNPGDPDPDFNGGVTRLLDFPDSYFDHATQVAVAPDGSIYVAGCNCAEDDSTFYTSLAHLTAGGDPVAGFGTDGIASDDDNTRRSVSGPTALGFAPDGDVLVGQSSPAYLPEGPPALAKDGSDATQDGDFTVVRYRGDTGAFVDQAREDFDTESDDVDTSAVRGFAPHGEGQLVLGSTGDGDLADDHFAAVTLDGADAITGTTEDEDTHADALTAGHQAGGPDGSYVIAGTGQTPGAAAGLRASVAPSDTPQPAWVLRRYDEDGTRDDSYGGDFAIDGAAQVDGIDASLAGDGATYVAATVTSGTGDGVTSTQEIVRFKADGTLDTGFATATGESIFGDAPSIFGRAYTLDAVAGTPDGKVVVVADHNLGFGRAETVVARLDADGSLDRTFGDGGVRTLPDAGDASSVNGEDAAVQSDGKAIIAGDASNFAEIELTRARQEAVGENEQQAYVTRLGAAGKPPVTTTTTTTTATTTATTTPVTTTTTTTTQTRPSTTTTAPPVAAQSAPAARSCSSKRSFAIRLRIPKADHPLSATVKVNGKTVKVVKGSRLRAAIDLRGLPKGTVKVSITVKLAGGKRSLKGQRVYHTCIPKQGDSIPVL